MGPSDGVIDNAPVSSDSAETVPDVDDDPRTAKSHPGSSKLDYLRPLFALLLLFLFLVGVQALSSGIKGLGKGAIDSFLVSVNNPFIGLVSGILATTLVQSSSVTTSLIVGMVAGGVLPLSLAVPMVMGANIGTTVTNTIAALAQIGRRNEFRRAFAAATCHDFFNYLTVVALLPLELATGVLTKASAFINDLLPAASGVTYKSPFKTALKACVHALEAAVDFFIVSETGGAIALIVLSVGLIFFSLWLIVRVMKGLVLKRMEGFVNKILGRGIGGGAMAILVGMVLTVMVQSSSITTSVMVPLAGAGIVRLWQVFPVTVGANIGTTVTALLASMAVSGPEVAVARQIAIVHLLFNVLGMALFYLPPWTRKWPMYAAQRLAKLAVKSRRWALLYVIMAFYGLPALLVFLGG